jgi:hypothetical protein
MNSRRKFFGQITTIFASSAAPSILLPKFADKFFWKPDRISEVKYQKLSVVWTIELEQDLQAYHSLSAEKQIEELIRLQSSPIAYSRRPLTDYVM